MRLKKSMDFAIQTDQSIPTRRPNFVLINVNSISSFRQTTEWKKIESEKLLDK